MYIVDEHSRQPVDGYIFGVNVGPEGSQCFPLKDQWTCARLQGAAVRTCNAASCCPDTLALLWLTEL
jgi:hypothetical protein